MYYIFVSKNAAGKTSWKAYKDVDNIVRDSTNIVADVLSVSNVKTEYGDLICLRPEMTGLQMDMVCGEIPSSENDSPTQRNV